MAVLVCREDSTAAAGLFRVRACSHPAINTAKVRWWPFISWGSVSSSSLGQWRNLHKTMGGRNTINKWLWSKNTKHSGTLHYSTGLIIIYISNCDTCQARVRPILIYAPISEASLCQQATPSSTHKCLSWQAIFSYSCCFATSSTRTCQQDNPNNNHSCQIGV